MNTFAHIANVNKRLIAQEAMLTLEFDSNITCGDAWAFRPQERHLGRIQSRRIVREIGAVEAGRIYSLLFEVRLPPSVEPRTPVARIKLSWRDNRARQEYVSTIYAPRLLSADQTLPRMAPEMAQIFSILDALRHPNNSEAELRALKARRELAIIEGRDPGLIAALEKQIDVIEGRTVTATLDQRDINFLEADQNTRATERIRPTWPEEL